MRCGDFIFSTRAIRGAAPSRIFERDSGMRSHTKLWGGLATRSAWGQNPAGDGWQPSRRMPSCPTSLLHIALLLITIATGSANTAQPPLHAWHISSDDPGPWPAILASTGLPEAAGGLVKVAV